jgi:hydrogenase-4 component B
VEWIFLVSGGLTVAYMTKLFVAVFVEKNRDAALQEKYDGQKKYMNGASTFALGGSALILFIWGLFPHALMEKAAALADGFMSLEAESETVRFFSFGNLKGGLISIGIGAFVYLFVVRKALCISEGEARVYVDRWPKWLDLEELLYRPVLLKLLPAVFGVLCRIPDSLADGIVVLLRKTIYRDSPLPHERPEGSAFTAALGRFLNCVQSIRNLVQREKTPLNKDYAHLLAVRREEIRENNRIIQRSLSFGLMLFGVGFCLTLLYLLLL